MSKTHGDDTPDATIDAGGDASRHKDMCMSPAHIGHPRRTARPVPQSGDPKARGSELWAQTVNLWWPWRLHEYPGWTVCAAEALGLAKASVKRWVYAGSTGLPARVARKIAALHSARAQREAELMQAWLEYAEMRDIDEKAGRVFPFRTMALEERQGWRSKRKA